MVVVRPFLTQVHREARHPNVVLYLGLSRAPEPDGRIFIISEYIEHGNLRNYIHDKNKPFPWRLRLSFATDIARALAYLHARKCIHRDLKGENLLVTANCRLKITDFGFARIAARNEEESKRLTFCGTDSYMSPEILIGNEFDLPTDIFSLGIIFCEIAARKLASDHTFKRHPPSFGIDSDEVRRLANPGCPPAFTALCLDCVAEDPLDRPTTRDILQRLRDIETEVLARPNEADDAHVGSIKFLTGMRRPGAAPRIPSFGMGVGRNVAHGAPSPQASDGNSSDEDSDEELVQAITTLSKVDLQSAWSNAAQGWCLPPLQKFITDASVQIIATAVRDRCLTIPPVFNRTTTQRSSMHTHLATKPLHLPCLLFSLCALVPVPIARTISRHDLSPLEHTRRRQLTQLFRSNRIIPHRGRLQSSLRPLRRQRKVDRIWQTPRYHSFTASH